jgi:hypothetical protein
MSDFSEAPPQRSWFGRNWGWLLGCGCLAPILLCGGVVGVGYVFTNNYFTTMKASDLYKEAVGKAKEDPSVKAQLGEPITESWWVGGAVDANSGKGVLVLTLTGPKGTGILMAEADKKAAQWDYKKLEVQIPNQGGGPPTTIDLLKDKDQNKAGGPGGDMKK